MAGENEKEYLTDDDLFEGDAAKLNEKIRGMVHTQIEDAVKAALEQRQKEQEEEAKAKGAGAPETLTREQLDGFDPETLDYAVFKDDDEDVKDTAKALFEREVKKLPDGATKKDVEAIADKVSKRLAKMSAANAENKQQDSDDDTYGGGPLPMNTAGAAAAHIKDTEPKTIEDAEALADKIAKSFK